MRRQSGPEALRATAAVALKALPLCVLAVGAAGLLHAQSASSASVHRERGYVNAETCAACHQKIWQTYQRTGMARSFSRPSPANTVEDYAKSTFYHRASDSYFMMVHRGGEYFQRRYQIGRDGQQMNVMEKRIDFIMGSGNHSRAYLHRTGRNTIVELPLAWYAEKGGYWAMNPGYDRPDHDGFRRAITYDCMFCHNAYPEIPASSEQALSDPVYTGALPEGIDCQRCHGPGARHAQLAKTSGVRPAAIRGSIVNPARLNAQRQMEVCMQCHLETTSFPLPNAIQRYTRGPFSYRPGEPISDFILFFDHAPGKGRDNKFEFVSAAYRLRQSACFRQSGGKLTCITCHNPHDIPHGEEAARRYNAICRQCHSAAFDHLVVSGKHPQSGACIDCHMPKRRTEDVVHAAVTDHFIQRRQADTDLLAELPERHESGTDAYRGPVALYYPKELPDTPENKLYLALAQVIQQSNLKEGIAQLTDAIQRYSPQRPEFYLQLAEAWRSDGHPDRALPFYDEAVRRSPNFVFGLQEFGAALRRAGRYSESLEYLKRAASAAPTNPITSRELGLSYQAQGNRADAIAALQRAVRLDPDMSEAHNNLGVVWLTGDDNVRAAAEFREAIRIQPHYADAHSNLASLLAATGDFADARDQFEIALRSRPRDAPTRYGLAMLLGRMRQFEEAQRQLEECLRADPDFAEAHQTLADLLMARNEAQLAIPHYREAVRLHPESGPAQIGLASALLKAGENAAAIPYLEKAAAGSDPAARDEAAQLLRQLGR